MEKAFILHLAYSKTIILLNGMSPHEGIRNFINNSATNEEIKLCVLLLGKPSEREEGIGKL